MKLYWQNEAPQTPLFIRLDSRDLWSEVQAACGLEKRQHAPIALAIYENARMGYETSYSRRNVGGNGGTCKKLLTRTHIVGTTNTLAMNFLIENMVQCPGGRGDQSAARATPLLLDTLDPVVPDTGTLPLLLPDRVVVTRDKNGNVIQPSNRSAFERLERPVWAINEMLMGTDIRTGTGLDIRCPVRRIFNGDYEHGGRLFAMGISHQNTPRDDRHGITINGEPTVELDFKAIHPAILYNKEGLRVPEDCYALGNFWPRDLVKLALLVLINADSLEDVINVLAHSDGEKILRDDEGEVTNITVERRLMKQITTDKREAYRHAYRLVEEVKQLHRPIKDYFHSGAGLWLMNKDSEIAMHVMKIMMAKGEPVLAVHDSFLVRRAMKDCLEEVMHEAAERAGVIGMKVTEKTIH